MYIDLVFTKKCRFISVLHSLPREGKEYAYEKICNNIYQNRSFCICVSLFCFVRRRWWGEAVIAEKALN